MSAEREILTTVLKLTKNGPVDYSLVGKAARIPAEMAENILRKLADGALIKWRGKVLEASPDQRVKVAVHALELGADSESVCRLLEWKEFESIATAAFEAYDYRVIKNFRFRERDGKRWEIDLLAFKQPTIASVDCKHWGHSWTRASVVKTVEEHVERTGAFADVLPRIHVKIEIGSWNHAKVIPIVLSLLPSPFKFYRDTPIVPVLQMQSFLNELPAHVDLLTHFSQKLKKIDMEITDYRQNPA